jgi:hypothetical protein
MEEATPSSSSATGSTVAAPPLSALNWSTAADILDQDDAQGDRDGADDLGVCGGRAAAGGEDDDEDDVSGGDNDEDEEGDDGAPPRTARAKVAQRQLYITQSEVEAQVRAGVVGWGPHSPVMRAVAWGTAARRCRALYRDPPLISLPQPDPPLVAAGIRSAAAHLSTCCPHNPDPAALSTCSSCSPALARVFPPYDRRAPLPLPPSDSARRGEV